MPESRVLSRRSVGGADAAHSYSYMAQDMGQTGTTQDRHGEGAVKADLSQASQQEGSQDMRAAALEAACASQTPRRASDASRSKMRVTHHSRNYVAKRHKRKR